MALIDMAGIERITVTVPADLAALVKSAVDSGDYASASEVIREALRDWQIKLEIRRRKMEALRQDIEAGLSDLDAGRIVEPNIDDIVEQAMQASAKCDPSG